MKNDIMYKLSYGAEKLKTVKEKIIEDIKTINTAMKKTYSDNCVIVVLSPCNKHGEMNHECTIHIFDNFLEANPLLNQEQFSDDKNISVIQYDLKHDKFLFILLKTYDTRNYKRLNKRQIQKMFSDLELESKILFLYNQLQSKIILHKSV